MPYEDPPRTISVEGDIGNEKSDSLVEPELPEKPPQEIEIRALLDHAAQYVTGEEGVAAEGARKQLTDELYSLIARDPAPATPMLFKHFDGHNARTLSYIPILIDINNRIHAELRSAREQDEAPHFPRVRELLEPFQGAALDARERVIGDPKATYLTQQALSVVLFELGYGNEGISFAAAPESFEVTSDHIGAAASDPELLREFVLLHQPIMKEIVEKDFGVRIDDLSTREQFYFLQYLRGVPSSGVEQVKKFCATYGPSGLRAFLACEHLGGAYGDIVVNYGNFESSKGNEYQAEVIFRHFSTLQDAVGGAERYLPEHAVTQEDRTVLHEVQKSIRNRAAQFLCDLLAQPLGNSMESYKRVLDAIEHAHTEAVTFTSAFRVLKERGEFSLAEVRNTSLGLTQAHELKRNTNDVAQMQAIIKANYKEYPEQFQKRILESLTTALDSQNTRFYVLRHSDEVIGFARFDELRDTDEELTGLHFGSFNTARQFGNGKLGEAVFEATIAEEKKHAVPIYAVCNPRAPITQRYIEDGFVANKLEDYEGVPSFSIVLNEEMNAGFDTKKWSTEQIIRAALTQNNERVKTFSAKRAEEIPFTLVNEGYVLTRFLKHGDRLFAVFEQHSEV